MRKIIIILLMLCSYVTQGQVVNNMPDYIYRYRLSIGRPTGTDSSAYVSIGPIVGSDKGLMIPRVADTLSVHPLRRNGLLIFSNQRNRFLWWDSLSVRWSDMSGTNIDTTVLSTRAWRKKGDDSLLLIINTKGTVLKVKPGVGTNFTAFTDSGLVSVDTAAIATKALVSKKSDSLSLVKQNRLTLTTNGNTGASTLSGDTLNIPIYRSGTVRYVGATGSRGITVTGSPITDSGTLSIAGDTLVLSTRSYRQKGIDSVLSILGSLGGGTVLSVASGLGMNFTTITSTGTVSADTAVLSSRLWRQKGVDSLDAIKQNKITLTTTGSSGASTFSSNTLNVPNYTLSGLGGVPTSRTITINGTSYDLSADRSWTVTAGGTGTVTSVSAGTGMNFSTITSAGSVNADTLVLSTRPNRQKAADSLGAIIATKVNISDTSSMLSNYVRDARNGVRKVAQYVEADTALLSTKLYRQKGIDSVISILGSLGGGTVMSVAAGTGMSFTTITSTGFVSADTSVLSTRAWRKKGDDSLGAIIATRVPQTRNITINGTTQNLSTDVTYNVGTVTSVGVTAGTGISVSGSPVTSSGNITVTNTAPDQIVSLTGAGTTTVSGSYPSFTITSVSDTGLLSTRAYRQKGVDSLLTLISSKGSGTVTSVGLASGTTGTDINVSGSPITTSGTFTLNVPTASASNRGALSSADWSTFNAKEPAIAFGTTSQYWRGDKSWQALTTSVVTENTNLYFTDARARGAFSLTTTGSSGAATYSSATGVLNVPNYTLSGLGGVVQSRTLTINGISYDLSADRSWTINTGITSLNGLSAGTQTFATGTSGADFSISSAGSIHTFNIPTASSSNRGLLSNSDWSIFNSKENAIAFGSVSQYWRGDKSWQTLNTAAVPESGNLYYTDGRARSALSLTTTGSSGAATYNSTTGAFNIPNYTLSGLGGEPVISAGTTSQYWRGDKTWQTLNTNAVAEGSNLYYTDARSRAAISLTTTGSSGASTYNSTTGALNVPNYTLAGLGGVSTSRTLTINGVAYDLSADRSWTIATGSGTVTSVGTGYGLTGGPITTTGTIVADTNSMSTRLRVKKQIDSLASLIGGSAAFTSSTLTAASGWNFARDIVWNITGNYVNKVSSGVYGTVTMHIIVYKTRSTFTTGSWVTVATLPVGYYKPLQTVYCQLPEYVEAADYKNASGTTDFASQAIYEGRKIFRITPAGDVQVLVDTVNQSCTLSGTNYVLFPLTMTWNIDTTPY